MRCASIVLFGLATLPAADPAALATAVADSPANPRVKAWIAGHGLGLMTDPAIVAAVQAQNAKAVPLAEIQRIDGEWQKAEAPLPIMAELQGNPAAQVLKTLAAAQPVLAEAFVMDAQGANVAMTAATSDYWQGDEAKWQNSFKGGAGGVDVGKEKLDKSTNTVQQQVSLPVIAGDGTVIGAITLGIAVGGP
jgi:hypothetical protein